MQPNMKSYADNMFCGQVPTDPESFGLDNYISSLLPWIVYILFLHVNESLANQASDYSSITDITLKIIKKNCVIHI